MANQMSVRRSLGTRNNGAWPRPRLFTIDEYDRMLEAGILGECEHVELVNGAILQMAPLGSRHADSLDRFVGKLVRGIREGDAIVRVQEPIRVPPSGAPEPDLAIVRYRAAGYGDRHPNPDEVLLVVEISDSSVRHDRDVKMPLYAAAGIPEAWRADLRGDRIFVCRGPSPDGYIDISEHRRGDTLSPIAFPELVLRVDDLLP